MNRFIFTALFLFAATFAAVAGNENEYEDSDYVKYMGKADTAIIAGDWEVAEQNLLNAIASDPNNPTRVMILSNLGLVQYNLGRDSLALRSLNEAHAMAPKSTKVLGNRAEVLMAMGRDDDAYADYTTILSLDSTLVESRYMHSLLA